MICSEIHDFENLMRFFNENASQHFVSDYLGIKCETVKKIINNWKKIVNPKLEREFDDQIHKITGIKDKSKLFIKIWFGYLLSELVIAKIDEFPFGKISDIIAEDRKLFPDSTRNVLYYMTQFRFAKKMSNIVQVEYDEVLFILNKAEHEDFCLNIEDLIDEFWTKIGDVKIPNMNTVIDFWIKYAYIYNICTDIEDFPVEKIINLIKCKDPDSLTNLNNYLKNLIKKEV